ncbi:MAG: HIRAN protein [Betaproteobacteria bacterium]|nr:MAG: HIRAN protein [Betaproteobacteria bacterium]
MPSVNRNALLATALFAGLCVLPVRIEAQQVRILVQSSPLAGFNYHQAPEVWQGMRVGDALALEREPDNDHDGRAINVRWRGHKLGYVPRAQNAALAWAMDRGESLDARVSRLQPHRNPRKRIEFEIYVE